ncbi:Phage protein [Lactococcus lactis subsp. lactis]|nr:Phage protein [Lactococcus lactis subsp. lactis]
MAIGKAFINIGKSLRPSNATVLAIDVPPIGLGADMKCYVEDIPGGRP